MFKKHCRFLFIIGLIANSLSYAADLPLASSQIISDKTIQVARQQLSFAKQKQLSIANKHNRLELDSSEILPAASHAQGTSLLDDLSLELKFAKTDMSNIITDKLSAQQSIDRTVLSIQALEDRFRNISLLHIEGVELATQELDFIQQQMSKQKILLKIQQQRYKVLLGVEKILKATIDELIAKRRALGVLVHAYEKRSREQSIIEFENKVRQQQANYLDQLAEYNDELVRLHNTNNNASEIAYLQMKIFTTEEYSRLTDVQLERRHLQSEYESYAKLELALREVRNLVEITNRLLTISKRIDMNRTILKRRDDVFAERAALIHSIKEQGILPRVDLLRAQASLDKLKRAYQDEDQSFTLLASQLDELSTRVKHDLRRQLAKRQGLPGFSVKAWSLLGQRILQLPKLFLVALHNLKIHTELVLASLPNWHTSLLIAFMSGFLLLWFWARYYLDIAIRRIEENREKFFVNTVYITLLLLRRNLGSLFFIGACLGFLFLVRVNFKEYAFLAYIGMVWLLIKPAIGLARITLYESVGDKEGRDVRLYHSLYWGLTMAGVTTAITVTVNQFPISYQVIDLFNCLFMVLMFLVSLALLKYWDILPDLFEKYIDIRRLYLKSLLRSLTLLFPIVLLANAVIGMLGYTELAWSIAKHAGIIVLLFAAYVVLRGGLLELMDLLSSLVIRKFRNGWLWTEAILKPIDKITRLLLLLAIVATAFHIFQWDVDPEIVTKLESLLALKLLAFDQISFSVLDVIKFAVVLTVLMWMTRWSREFAYRWLYSSISDLGLRNSLAVFTQYSVVAFGIYIALRVLHTDLTSIKFILGGLAIGFGFGLRDLANNFVSGLLMLIERPVRTGDFVDIDNHIGEVTHIGLRSVTVRTWDNMELIVPNSEVFSRSFVNWTRSDDVVRTIIKLRVNRVDDPHKVQNIVKQVLGETSSVLTEPEPQVFLSEMDDVLIQLEVRYFINMRKSRSRSRVRSEVLFRMWDRFKLYGIEPPYPQQLLHIKSLPNSVT